MKRFLFSRPVGVGTRGILVMGMLLMSLGYSGADVAYALPPANDDFDSAIQINAIEFHATPDTTEATPVVAGGPGDDPDNIPCPEPGDPNKVLNYGFASVWYKYTPPEDQGIALNTANSSYDTFIAVWTGTRGNLNLVACNDETFEGFAELSFIGTAGTTYFIQVAQFNDGTGGTTFFGGDLVFNAFITNTNVRVGGALKGRYFVPETGALLRSIIKLDAGPVEIFNVANNQIIASERVIYKENGIPTSFSETLGLPAGQVDKIYRLTWYNNKTMETQLRITNVSATTASIRVRIGGVEMPGNPFNLAAGATVRKSYPGIDKGLVSVISSVNLVVSERVFYKVNGVIASYSEIMALPQKQVHRVYWLPWYNSKTMTSQLQISNVSPSTATIRILIGGKLMKGTPFTLLSGKTKRLSAPGIDRGPVKIISNVNIVASERVIYRLLNGTPVSFTEVMALPHGQLDTIYWLPFYTKNNAVATQLRFGNASATTATVRVYIRGVEMPGSPFTVPVGTSKRVMFNGVNTGPVKIESNVKIIAGARIIYTVGGKPTSYSETVALPNKQLSSRYWMTWYNNKTIDTQLRIALP
jgi:hypothetical protein